MKTTPFLGQGLFLFQLRSEGGVPLATQQEACLTARSVQQLTWKWKMAPWKTTFLYKQVIFSTAMFVSQSV